MLSYRNGVKDGLKLACKYIKQEIMKERDLSDQFPTNPMNEKIFLARTREITLMRVLSDIQIEAKKLGFEIDFNKIT